ncbi:MAG TPA: L,D-transpeptidase family protein [Solirubrobacteraceae bacterium]|nr:L,D-transpeptidase family protein [Solirubrobacteraceae bacterium]
MLIGAAVGALIVSSASASLTTDPQALAKVGMPLGGGRIASVEAVTGPQDRQVPVVVRGNQIWPRGTVPAGERITINVVVRRPGWISWLAGSSERIRLVVVAPTAKLTQSYVTLASNAPLRIHFSAPVAAFSSGAGGAQLSRHVLASPTNTVTLARTAAAGSIWVAGVPRTWETMRPTVISWFPAGAATAAVANPSPGTQLKPNTPITLTFSKSVSSALGNSMPPVSPVTSGTWHQLNSHTIEFRPEGYGYGLGAKVTVGLPAAVKLVGGPTSGSSSYGAWGVPGGSTTRLQQLLANLGYLPLRFNGNSPEPTTPQGQMNAAIDPPSGSFSWRYPNVPGNLRSMWAPGVSGEMTKGAVMAFEDSHGMTADGTPGPQVWRALMLDALAGHKSTFGYTFVGVSEGSPESIDVWHNGKTVVTGPVNTGIPQAPTAQGTFAVFEHSPSVTMSGTNPDGSHYSDPGVPWVSYFNGGDALHGFLRASYGSAQSLGCVEMSYSQAAAVYPYTPIGTLVNVT